VRELQNVIERAVILSKGERLRFDLAFPGSASPSASAVSAPLPSPDVVFTEREWRDRERSNLIMR
jgi:DNA-binding NtrC family response regulator